LPGYFNLFLLLDVMMSQTNSKNQAGDAKVGTLGTFAGVFTPSILTILGIILFLRLGFVVGNAGLGHALLILALANGISVLTTFSLSAIATNLKVKGGGDYYLISHFIVSVSVKCWPGPWRWRATAMPKSLRPLQWPYYLFLPG
jgi:hypothetical protein